MTTVEIISLIGASTGIGALYNSIATAKTATATATKTIEEVYGGIVKSLRDRVGELEKQIKALSIHTCDNYDCEFRNKKMP
jgi:hypothetical protein